MPNDHYVAQTYLRHFADSRGMLHVYGKADGKYWSCNTKGVCHEWDGDLIRDFLSDERALGKYRATFENTWNDAITDLGNGTINRSVKFAIAGYWANLMVCTPAWRRVGLKIYHYGAMHRLRVEDILRTEVGKPDLKLKEILGALDAKRFRLTIEPDAIRAQCAAMLMKFAWALYNAEWRVIRNKTEIPFLTSDNPVAFEDFGPWNGDPPGLPRYLPISPHLCLDGFMDPRDARGEPDFAKPPRGHVEWGSISVQGVEIINKAIAQCAEEVVIAPAKLASIQTVVAECARHRVDVEFINFRGAKSFLLGNCIRVCEPEVDAHT